MTVIEPSRPDRGSIELIEAASRQHRAVEAASSRRGSHLRRALRRRIIVTPTGHVEASSLCIEASSLASSLYVEASRPGLSCSTYLCDRAVFGEPSLHPAAIDGVLSQVDSPCPAPAPLVVVKQPEAVTMGDVLPGDTFDRNRVARAIRGVHIEMREVKHAGKT